MKLVLISLLVSGVLGVSASARAKAFDTNQLLCDGPKMAPVRGLCSEKVRCAVLADQERQQITTYYGEKHPENKSLTYDKIPLRDRLSFLSKLNPQPDYFPATVSCEAKLIDNKPVCDLPDDCKDQDPVITSNAVSSGNGDAFHENNPGSKSADPSAQ